MHLRGVYNLPINILSDSRSTILLSSDPILHEGTKHIQIDVQLVRVKFTEGVVKVLTVDTSQQVENILTKLLAVKQHDFYVKN